VILLALGAIGDYVARTTLRRDGNMQYRRASGFANSRCHSSKTVLAESRPGKRRGLLLFSNTNHVVYPADGCAGISGLGANPWDGARVELIQELPDLVYERGPRTVPAVPSPLPEPTRKASSRRYTNYFIFTLCSAIYLLPFMRLLLRGTDEGTLVYGAVRIVHGQVFARDFFEVMGPGTFYWLAAFFKFLGVSFVAERTCLFVTSLGTWLLMYYLSRRVCRKYWILPTVLLVGTCFGALWPVVSHHADSNLFALLSVACILIWHDTRRNSLLLAAGALAAVTTCILQPKGILLIFSILLWLSIQCWRRFARLSALGLIMGSYCGVAGFILLYFWSQGALRNLLYINFVWPSQHYGAVNAVPYAQGILQYWNHWAISVNGSGG
jgi:hypothetical protein